MNDNATVDVRNMTAAQYRVALQNLLAQAGRRQAEAGARGTIEGMLAQNPDLAAAADKKAHDAHRALGREYVAAALALKDAAAAAKVHELSPMLRREAADRLRAAETEHDRLLIAVKTSHAELPKEQ